MKIRIITSIICLIMALSLVGCTATTETININVKRDNTLSGNTFGMSALIEIGDKLWYDSTTRIVYWWNGWINGTTATVPSPYYAPNGLPYRYNPETNTFEEIKDI